MTNEIKWLLEELIKYGLGFTAAGIIFYLIITRWLSSYLNEKGKNLATKEDVAQITNLVKGVEHQYNVLIEEMKSKQQLRMAAIDKRLQTHQDALALWFELLRAGRGDRAHVADKCYDWWNKNCLYLEPEVRAAFMTACSQPHLEEEREKQSPAAIEKWFKETMQFTVVLFNAVQLPSFSQEEQKSLRRKVSDGIDGTN